MNFDHPPSDPIAEFHRWLEEAKATGLPNPNAMTLATVDPDGSPSARVMLMKELDNRGAVFFTNRTSRKSQSLDHHPHAALLFFWDPLGRQVRMEGPVEPISDAEADAYFATRPRMSQIGAWASRQSQPVPSGSRAELDAAVREIEQRFPEPQPVPRPPHWGGYRVNVERIEFWQAHPYRLHDRVVYQRDADGTWTAQRLFP
jgi:pyridoxamine 5'-phosphate oxidase